MGHDSTWMLLLVFGRATFHEQVEMLHVYFCTLRTLSNTVSSVVMMSLLTSVPVVSNSSLVISTTHDDDISICEHYVQ